MKYKTLTDINHQSLFIATPLNIIQAASILTLIETNDLRLIEKITREAIAFSPTDTYYKRLKKALILCEI